MLKVNQGFLFSATLILSTLLAICCLQVGMQPTGAGVVGIALACTALILVVAITLARATVDAITITLQGLKTDLRPLLELKAAGASIKCAGTHPCYKYFEDEPKAHRADSAEGCMRSSRAGGLMSFGEALLELKAGKRLRRTGWNGKGQFIYLVPAASYPVQTGAAKEHFGEGALVPYNAYMAIKGVDDTVSTWAPSVNDCLSEDWIVMD